jgi:hypothetical protein
VAAVAKAFSNPGYDGDGEYCEQKVKNRLPANLNDRHKIEKSASAAATIRRSGGEMASARCGVRFAAQTPRMEPDRRIGAAQVV